MAPEFTPPMPNIKQQEKRVRRSARSGSRISVTVDGKTDARAGWRRAAAEAGDDEAIAAEHRELVRWIDKAASHGALHRNTAARKKAQAAQLASRSS